VNVVTAGKMPPQPAELCAQYFDQSTSTWSYLDGANGPCVTIHQVNLRVSDWLPLAATAKDDVDVRVVGNRGDGVAAPSFGNISIEVK
jgi:hypothetical protein